MPNNKKFLNFFLSLTILLNIFFYFYLNSINLILISFTAILVLSRIFFSNYIYPLNIFWYRIGFFLSRFVSPIILGIIYFSLITPIALLMRIFRFDPLKNGDVMLNSTWITQDKKINFKDQF
jgi:hypothetical protein